MSGVATLSCPSHLVQVRPVSSEADIGESSLSYKGQPNEVARSKLGASVRRKWYPYSLVSHTTSLATRLFRRRRGIVSGEG